MASSILLTTDIYVGGTKRTSGTTLTTSDLSVHEMARLVDKKSATWVIGSRNATKEDVGTIVNTSGSTAFTLTIPNDVDVGWSLNDAIALYQGGSGAATFAAGVGVTFRGTAPASAQYSTIGIMRVGVNEWAYL